MVYWYNEFNDRHNNLLDKFFSSTHNSQTSYDVKEENDSLHLSIDLPGAKSSDVNVNAAAQLVSITGKRKGKNFNYSYNLPKAYDSSTGFAKVEDGVLTLLFKKKLAAATNSFSIKVN